MRLPRVMHVEANLLDCIRKIGSGESEILQCASKTPKISWISNRDTIRGKLRVQINRCGAGLAVCHPSTVKDL
jgi:hypothetical protein